MKNKLTGISILILVLVTLACNTSLPPDSPPAIPTQPANPASGNLPRTEDEVPRVSLEQAITALESGVAILVDVRSAESYAAGHVVGAISIPLSEFENNIDGIDLDKDQWIITYCT